MRRRPRSTLVIFGKMCSAVCCFADFSTCRQYFLSSTVFASLMKISASRCEYQLLSAVICAYARAIGSDGCERGVAANPVARADLPSGEHHAGGETLDVPFPRGGQRLIEIVDVENQAPLGGTVTAEIQQVGVAAGLHAKSGLGSAGEVRGHQGRRSAEKRERGLDHSAVADRQQLGQAAMV